jgi:hypothetical protein
MDTRPAEEILSRIDLVGLHSETTYSSRCTQCNTCLLRGQ